jgi:hypothetical protein
MALRPKPAIAMPTFFATAEEFGAWLSKHASSEPELIVGFYKRDSGYPSMTWPESVGEALCVGWIDGVRTRIDEVSYKIRFTPPQDNIHVERDQHRAGTCPSGRRPYEEGRTGGVQATAGGQVEDLRV